MTKRRFILTATLTDTDDATRHTLAAALRAAAREVEDDGLVASRVRGAHAPVSEPGVPVGAFKDRPVVGSWTLTIVPDADVKPDYHDSPEEMLRVALEVVRCYRTRHHGEHRDGLEVSGVVPTSVAQDADALIAEAKALGIEFNKDRWL